MSIDVIKNNCDQWVDYAYEHWLGWLRSVKPKQYYLRESTRILVERMKNLWDAGQREESWYMLERLKKLGTNIHGMRNDFGGDDYLYEQAEIQLECAVAAYKMGDIQEAIALLDMTNGSFQNRSVHRAVSCWARGCVQWQSQTLLEEALVNWEKSCRIMTELASGDGFDHSFAEGCKKIVSDMAQAIRDSSRNNYPPPPPAASSTSAHPAVGAKPQPSRLRIFPIIGSIPAGSPVGIVDDSTEKTYSDGFEIDGYFYKAYNLRDGAFINLNQNQRYYLLKVKGESMNNALPVNIEDGDYVIMVKQDGADSGDIIAAEIDNEDREATLKRYYHRDGRYILEPQSCNPTLKEHLTFTRDFYIRGKAIAVLKRDG